MTRIPPRLLGLIDAFERATVVCCRTPARSPDKSRVENAKSAAKARLFDAVIVLANINPNPEAESHESN